MKFGQAASIVGKSSNNTERMQRETIHKVFGMMTFFQDQFSTEKNISINTEKLGKLLTEIGQDLEQICFHIWVKKMQFTLLHWAKSHSV